MCSKDEPTASEVFPRRNVSIMKTFMRKGPIWNRSDILETSLSGIGLQKSVLVSDSSSRLIYASVCV